MLNELRHEGIAHDKEQVGPILDVLNQDADGLNDLNVYVFVVEGEEAREILLQGVVLNQHVKVMR
jgi:hypothetical protein